MSIYLSQFSDICKFKASANSLSAELIDGNLISDSALSCLSSQTLTEPTSRQDAWWLHDTVANLKEVYTAEISYEVDTKNAKVSTILYVDYHMVIIEYLENQSRGR